MADPPVINLGWLTDSTGVDAQVAVAAFKGIRQAWSTISNITIGAELAPGPRVQSNADILAYIRNASTTLYHAAATCAMGKRGDENAVVDSNARVSGVKGVRVVVLLRLLLSLGIPNRRYTCLRRKLRILSRTDSRC